MVVYSVSVMGDGDFLIVFELRGIDVDGIYFSIVIFLFYEVSKIIFGFGKGCVYFLNIGFKSVDDFVNFIGCLWFIVVMYW